MTIYLDTDTGDVLDDSGTVIGTLDGPPYRTPDQIDELLADQVVADATEGNTQATVEALARIHQEDYEFGRP